MKMKLIFLGPPGSGKGTQAKVLAQKLNLPQISTGDIFRYNIKNHTELGIKAREFNDKGLLVPDNITNEMVKERIQKDYCVNGYILDGYPRTINQAEFLAKFQDINKVINLELSEEEVINRISGRRTCLNCGEMYHIMYKSPNSDNKCKCGNEIIQRDDDKPEAVKIRLQVYKKQTEPLIEFYTNKGIILNIDASPGIEEISEKIFETLSKNI